MCIRDSPWYCGVHTKYTFLRTPAVLSYAHAQYTLLRTPAVLWYAHTEYIPPTHTRGTVLCTRSRQRAAHGAHRRRRLVAKEKRSSAAISCPPYTGSVPHTVFRHTLSQ
eukprot:1166365-Rhodomonas_salina.2